MVRAPYPFGRMPGSRPYPAKGSSMEGLSRIQNMRMHLSKAVVFCVVAEEGRESLRLEHEATVRRAWQTERRVQ